VGVNDVVVVVDPLVVELIEVVGAPVLNRQPDPGGLNVARLTSGVGSLICDGVAGVVVVGATAVVVGCEVGTVVVTVDGMDVVERMVVGDATVGWCESLSWKPTIMSADTQMPSTTRRGHVGPSLLIFAVFAISFGL
jgi:hypothetical protein